MPTASVAAGLIVIVFVPVPLTFELPTAMVSMVELSEVFLIVILPLSTSTTSLKVRTILALTPTPVALSAGAEDDKAGTVLVIGPVKLSGGCIIVANAIGKGSTRNVNGLCAVTRRRKGRSINR